MGWWGDLALVAGFAVLSGLALVVGGWLMLRDPSTPYFAPLS